jgi:hypothetical protein
MGARHHIQRAEEYLARAEVAQSSKAGLLLDFASTHFMAAIAYGIGADADPAKQIADAARVSSTAGAVMAPVLRLPARPDQKTDTPGHCTTEGAPMPAPEKE